MRSRPTCRSAESISFQTSSTAPSGVQRHELAGHAVVLDDRLGLVVVDREAPRDHLGRVVGAVLDRGARGSARSIADLVGHVEEEDRVEPLPDAASSRSSASACSRLRGKPSSTKPVARIVVRRAARGSARSSARRGRASPALEQRLDLPAELGAVRRSPHGTCRPSRRAERRTPRRCACACVPFPAPCGPRTRRFTAGSPRSCASSSATPSGASCRARRRRRSARRCRRARGRSPARSRSS